MLLALNETYPNIVDVFSIGKSWQDRDIYCVRLTNETDTSSKPQLLFVGYHHAREPITAELSLYFTVDAATKYGTNEAITRLLNRTEIYVVPALNVDGFDAVRQNEWQRKNLHPIDEDGDGLFDEDPPDDENGDGYIGALYKRNEWGAYDFFRWEGVDDDTDGLLNEDWMGGVDINRNYGYQWNASCQSGSSDPNAEDYIGNAPFSEPETQAIRDLALQHNFTYAVSFHSGIEDILYPWGYAYTPTPHDTLFREIAANLSALVNAPYEQAAAYYTMSGSWDDWMYGNRSIMTLTCEIYQNDSALQYEQGPTSDTIWEKGVYEYFNPDPNVILSVIARWLPAFTYIIDRAIVEPQLHDIAITRIYPFKSVIGASATEGYTMGINVTLVNEGETNELSSISVYANGQLIQTLPHCTVPARGSSTYTFIWNATGWIFGNYNLTAYAKPVWWETHKTDNYLAEGQVFITIPGDVTADKLVNAKDAIPLGLAFSSTPAQPAWNPNADINDDKTVNAKDALILGNHFGRRLETTATYLEGFNDNQSIYQSAYYGGNWYGLMYTPTSSYYIKGVQLIAGSGTGNYTIQLRPDDQGMPSNTVLREFIFNMSQGLGWQGGDFSDSYYLAAGTTYWIVFKPIPMSRCSFAQTGTLITSAFDWGTPGWDSKSASYYWMAKFYGEITTEKPISTSS